MPTSYPGAIDTFSNPASGTALNDPAIPHAAQHANANDAIEAIETLLGANGVNYVSVAGAQTISGAKTFTAENTRFGTGAAGAAGSFIRLSGAGAPDAFVMAEGSVADIALSLRSKGAGAIHLENVAGGGLSFTPVDGATGVLSGRAGGGLALRHLLTGSDVGNVNMGNGEVVLFVDEAASALRFRYRTSGGVGKLATVSYANG